MVLKTFKGKKVVISAGASGLGLEIAKKFLDLGANIYICEI